ncbi:MAG: hypothetical protein KFH87_13655, partial [Bacteroidetes bacterium]|nr:hypothetical protein [Bacteroidota bacterium]
IVHVSAATSPVSTTSPREHWDDHVQPHLLGVPWFFSRVISRKQTSFGLSLSGPGSFLNPKWRYHDLREVRRRSRPVACTRHGGGHTDLHRVTVDV